MEYFKFWRKCQEDTYKEKGSKAEQSFTAIAASAKQQLTLHQHVGWDTDSKSIYVPA
jgi:hypothetical protein